MHIFYYSYTDSPIGRLVLATEGEHLVALGLAQSDTGAQHWLRSILKNAGPFHLVYSAQLPAHASITRAVIAFCHGQPATVPQLELYGTEFQKRVWNALLDVPRGQTTSYKDIARRIGSPKSVRAVGAAVLANPVSLFVPCHRVITGVGEPEDLHRIPTKEQLLAQERQRAA